MEARGARRKRGMFYVLLVPALPNGIAIQTSGQSGCGVNSSRTIIGDSDSSGGDVWPTSELVRVKDAGRCIIGVHFLPGAGRGELGAAVGILKTIPSLRAVGRAGLDSLVRWRRQDLSRSRPWSIRLYPRSCSCRCIVSGLANPQSGVGNTRHPASTSPPTLD